MGEYGRGPRSGLPGAWDRLVGPGATKLENAGTLGAAFLGVAVGLYGGPSAKNRGPLRRVAAALIGADLFGGA